MTRQQLRKQLELIHKDLTKVETRMMKVADKLGIDRHEWVERSLWEIEKLLKMFEEKDIVD